MNSIQNKTIYYTNNSISVYIPNKEYFPGLTKATCLDDIHRMAKLNWHFQINSTLQINKIVEGKYARKKSGTLFERKQLQSIQNYLRWSNCNTSLIHLFPPCDVLWSKTLTWLTHRECAESTQLEGNSGQKNLQDPRCSDVSVSQLKGKIGSPYIIW